MPPSVSQGVRTTVQQGNESRRERDVFNSLLKLQPNAAPFTVIMGKIRKKSATDPKVEWYEDDVLPEFDTLGAAIASGAVTSITVSNYKRFRINDLVLVVETGEILLVTATPSSTTVSVQRAFGDVSAAAASNGGKLTILGSAYEENATSGDVINTVKEQKFNYLGIVRDPFSLSNTAKATKTYGGSDFEIEAATNGITHKRKLERMMLQGQRYEDTSGTEPRRSSRGIVRWISTNVVNVGGDLTEGVFDSWLRRLFQYGGSTRILFNAPIVTEALTGFAKEKLRVVDQMKSKYGLDIKEYVTPFGTCLLANHKLMVNESLNDFDDIAGMAIGVDMDNVFLRHMEGRITVRKENIQENDRDGRKDEFLSEAGLQVGLEKTHGLLTGVTG